jgi:hypothetical protein
LPPYSRFPTELASILHLAFSLFALIFKDMKISTNVLFFWCRLQMKECLSLRSKWTDLKGKCRRAAVRADVYVMNLRIRRTVALDLN